MTNLHTRVGDKLRDAKKKKSEYAYGTTATYWAGYADALADITGAHYFGVMFPYCDSAVWMWLTEEEAKLYTAAGYHLTR